MDPTYMWCTPICTCSADTPDDVLTTGLLLLPPPPLLLLLLLLLPLLLSSVCVLCVCSPREVLLRSEFAAALAVVNAGLTPEHQIMYVPWGECARRHTSEMVRSVICERLGLCTNDMAMTVFACHLQAPV
jgi:hypothetical protein